MRFTTRITDRGNSLLLLLLFQKDISLPAATVEQKTFSFFSFMHRHTPYHHHRRRRRRRRGKRKKRRKSRAAGSSFSLKWWRHAHASGDKQEDGEKSERERDAVMHAAEMLPKRPRTSVEKNILLLEKEKRQRTLPRRLLKSPTHALPAYVHPRDTSNLSHTHVRRTYTPDACQISAHLKRTYTSEVFQISNTCIWRVRTPQTHANLHVLGEYVHPRCT